MKIRAASQARSRSKTVALGSMAAFLVMTIILFPDAAFQSSLRGLTIWWELVFPALLPFLILTELLIGFGAVQAAGTLLEPIMRLLFRLPGVGGWALASGLIIGFPIGAKITASLREKGLLSRQDAQRLISITHLCSPLFLITVVGVGFLHEARLGVLLALIHYLAAIMAGLLPIWNKQARRGEASASHTLSEATADTQGKETSIFKRSVQTMQEAYLHDGRAFGKLLGDAVTASVQALMLIGGYMMIYSVMINVLTLVQLTTAIQQLTAGFLDSLQLGPDLISYLLSGLFEIHLGAYSLAQEQGIPLVWQMALLSALLSWGGLSAHAQVGAFIQNTDIRYIPFFITRCFQALIAFTLTFVLWQPLHQLVGNGEPTWVHLHLSASTQDPVPLGIGLGLHAWQYWQPMLFMWVLALALMMLFSVLLWGVRKRT